MNIPILLVIYNRSEKLLNLIDSLNNYVGLRIYIAADGPKNNEVDRKKCISTRSLVDRLSNSHTLIKLYSEVNLGCAKNCTRAISIFFEYEEFGIILEDDIKFNEDFFIYCQYALNRYKDDYTIFSISGSPYINIEIDYPFLSSYPNIWGWATWKRSWVDYSVDLNQFSNIKILTILFRKFDKVSVVLYWFLVLNLARRRKLDMWDHQFYFYMWAHSAFTLVPSAKYTLNIGFDGDATCMIKPPNGYNPNNFEFSKKFKSTTLPPVFNEQYDILVEKKIFNINFYNIFKLLIKCLVWKAKSWD